MAKLSKQKKQFWSYFLDDQGRIAYCELCRKCKRDCKQSFRSVMVRCPHFVSKRSVAQNF